MPASLTYETTGSERLVSVLYHKVEELGKKVHDLEVKKIIDETQLSTELLENSGLLPKEPKKLKRGRGYRPLLQSEIEEAKKHSPFAAGQARWLGVAHTTFRKYAEQYGIYEPKPNEKGKRNLFDPNRGRYPLDRILAGEFNNNAMFKKRPAVADWSIKDKLIRSGTFPAKCNICGYDKRRIGDNKIALLIDHKDGNLNNFKLENLQLLCFNCTFECGRGYIRRGNHMFDPDWMQGADADEIDPRTRW
jgi:5-methylcytosine-specific restriction endonuclease McrA